MFQRKLDDVLTFSEWSPAVPPRMHLSIHTLGFDPPHILQGVWGSVHSGEDVTSPSLSDGTEELPVWPRWL